MTALAQRLPVTSADLDAMTVEEAWDKCCYAAWIMRRQEREQGQREEQLADWRAQTAASVARFWAALTPEERVDITRKIATREERK